MKRRTFFKTVLAATAGVMGMPTIISSSAFAKHAPMTKSISPRSVLAGLLKSHDLPETIKHDMCRVVAVADVDMNRAKDGKKWIDDYYAKKTGKADYMDVKVYQDYREMLQDKSIDAVIISTPDHWHAQPAIEAALEGKDIYLQKPASLTIAEGRAMSDAVMKRQTHFSDRQPAAILRSLAAV